MTSAPSAALLFGPPAVTSVRPSPDGSRLAYLAPHDGVTALWVSDLDGEHARALAIAPLTSVRWSADGRGLLFLRDGGGDELHHLWYVDVETSEARDLTPHDGVQAQVVGLSARRPREAAVALNVLDPARHDLYLLNLDGAGLQGPVRRGALRYAVDGDLRPVLEVRLGTDGSAEILAGEGRRVDLVAAADTVPLVLGPLCASHDGRTAYVLHSAGSATVALHRYDLRSGARTVVHQDETFDVTGFSTDPVTGEVDLVCVDGVRRRWHGPLASELEGEDDDLLELHRSGDDAVRVLVRIRDDRPPVHEVRHRPHGTSRLLEERPDLAGVDLARTRPVTVSARDGLLLRGYLTAARDAPAGPLPTVLWVHGGPWARDRWGFDPIVQFLATRGYLVVQVNYRGSSGYGKAFMDAGDREWGARMQTDLSDVVDHLVGEGLTDPRRIAIAGGSYGGYATLMGLLTEPERYACGIAWCAPSNLLTLLRSFPPYWADLMAHWHLRVGHPDEDEELLRERSPLTHLDRLRVPLLLVHGSNDPRVLVEESRAVAEALKARGVPHVFHEVPGEGHGFLKPESNVWLLDQMGAFLAEHLAQPSLSSWASATVTPAGPSR